MLYNYTQLTANRQPEASVDPLMDGFFSPRSVAVVGASADASKGGHSLVINLKHSLDQDLYLVNPRYQEILGVPCFPSPLALPQAPDLAIVFLPPQAVPQALEDLGRRGVKRVMIQSAGFGEVGPEGRALQARCLEIARAHGMRLWGPNCVGLVDGQQGRVLSFMRPSIWQGALKAGDVSLIVQSGALAGGFLMQVLSEGYFGISRACSIGNRCDINECDVLEYLAQDPHTQVVAMYLESVAEPARFRRAVAGLGKPVVLLKGGTSQAGAQAALSHTGSLAGDALVAEGYFRQLGLHRAHDFLELMDLTKALSLWRGRQGGPRVAVVTWSGGAGIVNSDHLARQGLSLAGLSPQTLERLAQVYPAWMKPGNPCDIWPAIEKVGYERAYAATLEALVHDPQVDALQVHFFLDDRSLGLAPGGLEPVRGAAKPVTFWAVGDTRLARPFRELAEGLGGPVFGEISRGVRALSLLAGPAKPAA